MWLIKFITYYFVNTWRVYVLKYQTVINNVVVSRVHFKCSMLLFSYHAQNLYKLEDTARYAGFLLAPAEGFGRGFFCTSGKKIAYYAVLGNFW